MIFNKSVKHEGKWLGTAPQGTPFIPSLVAGLLDDFFQFSIKSDHCMTHSSLNIHGLVRTDGEATVKILTQVLEQSGFRLV